MDVEPKFEGVELESKCTLSKNLDPELVVLSVLDMVGLYLTLMWPKARPGKLVAYGAPRGSCAWPHGHFTCQRADYQCRGRQTLSDIGLSGSHHRHVSFSDPIRSSIRDKRDSKDTVGGAENGVVIHVGGVCKREETGTPMIVVCMYVWLLREKCAERCSVLVLNGENNGGALRRGRRALSEHTKVRTVGT